MALLSVSQYAARTGKDTGNIRRMLASGRLKGTKIGNQWVIDEETVYPDDNRLKNGECRNWRQRVSFNSNKELSQTVRQMVEDLKKIYGSHLSSVILYGSYARGDQTDESDVDIALLLSPGHDKKMYDAMIDCVSGRELECGKVLSVIDIDIDKYEEWKDVLPFYKNVRKEGIVLWKKAG